MTETIKIAGKEIASHGRMNGWSTPGNSLLLPKEQLQHSGPYVKNLIIASKKENRELFHMDVCTMLLTQLLIELLKAAKKYLHLR